MKRMLLFFICFLFSIDAYSAVHPTLRNYLLPTREKVFIKNWEHPTEEDYWNLQNYLSYSSRLELNYCNYPGTYWREQRLRDFKIITKDQIPEFNIIHFNRSESDKVNCIVTYVSISDSYLSFLHRLIDHLYQVGFDGDLIYWIGGWPNTEEGSLELFDVPYAFKICSLLEAKRLGYKNALWLDSCFVPIRKLDVIFEHIDKAGLFFMAYPEYSLEGHITKLTSEALGISLSEFLQMATIQSFCFGINFYNEVGLNLLNEWHELAKKKISFLSFIPELATLTFLVNKRNLLSLSGNESWIVVPNAKSDETVLLWERY